MTKSMAITKIIAALNSGPDMYAQEIPANWIVVQVAPEEFVTLTWHKKEKRENEDARQERLF